MPRGNDWWDHWFLGMAKYVSTASKDPSTQLGAVIVDNRNRIISTGYNGFPRGVEDTETRLNNREVKYSMMVHGEMNAILFATQPLIDTTLYIWPFFSCSACATVIINSGIKRVVAPISDNPRWKDSFALSQNLYSEAGVQVALLPTI